jgi:hypothetical protein
MKKIKLFIFILNCSLIVNAQKLKIDAKNIASFMILLHIIQIQMLKHTLLEY